MVLPSTMFKQDLIFRPRVTNAAGSLGFALDSRVLQDIASLAGGIGAFVTNPISLRPRAAAAHPALVEYPGGFLLHSGIPNPGFKSVMRRYGPHWRDSSVPVIAHLMADRPEETQQMVEALEGMENVMAVEFGFAPLLADDIILLAIEKCLGELPLIISLPSDQLLSLGPRCLQLGAAAVSMAAPRGAVTQNGTFITGRLFGPSLFPRSLDLVMSAVKLNLPIIGAGGVYSKADVQTMLSAGALAVQVDAAFWLPVGIEKDPVN